MSSVAEGIAIGAAAGGGLIATFAWYFIKKQLDKRDIPNFDLDRFVETRKDYVGIHNTDARSIDACLISCDGKVCWWDDKSEDRRIIASGGGGNVLLLFSGSEDPLVIVKSRKRTLRKIRYSKISKRK